MNWLVEVFTDENGDLTTPAGFAIAGMLTFFGVLLTVLVSYLATRHQIRAGHVQKVAEFRQTWIRELRDEFAGVYAILNSEGSIAKLEQFWLHYAKIHLLLSRRDKNFPRLNDAIRQVVAVITSEERTGVREAMENFLVVTNDILKLEWRRIRDDLENGKV